MNLISMLKAALVHHKISVPYSVSTGSLSSTSSDPQLRYIRDILFEDESDAEFNSHNEKNYIDLYLELEHLVNHPVPPKLAPPCDGFTYFASGNVRTLRPDKVQSLLMYGAQALVKNNVLELYKTVESLQNTSIHGEWTSKIAYYYVQALLARLTGTGSIAYKENGGDISLATVCSMPTTVSNAFATTTILERTQGATHVHIIDYGINHGDQWPALIKAFSERPGGPPHLTITGIDFPHYTRVSTGTRLLEYAKYYGVTMMYESILTQNWELVKADLRRSSKALLIVNCNLRLRHLREDGIGITSPRKILLENIFKMKPDLVVQCETGTNLGGPFFLQRFQQSLRYFSSVMECYYPGMDPADEVALDKVMSSSVLNVVACEGMDRQERPASYKEWDRKMTKAGFVQAPISPMAYADVLRVFKNGHPGTVRQEKEWLVAEHRNVALYAMCAWTLPKTGDYVF